VMLLCPLSVSEWLEMHNFITREQQLTPPPPCCFCGTYHKRVLICSLSQKHRSVCPIWYTGVIFLCSLFKTISHLSPCT
jgi:hypothetical protein